jgi:DNA repair exonuclease SbcCD ATPase subunit
MIIFKSIKYKNFLSTGNAWNEIKLNSHKTTLIVGNNGAGKSTMLDAICFALYGKPFRKINKPQLVNSINQKNMEVELTFDIMKNSYIIKRGMKPNIFEIWKNGVLLNQDAASRDYQAYLEQNILKMNYKSFGQIVVLGSSTFVPFMQLPAQHRREVIEDLLDIQVFSTMNVLLKDKVSNNKTESQDLKFKIDIHKDRIKNALEHNASIRKMKEEEVNAIQDKIDYQKKFLDSEMNRMEGIETRINDMVQLISDKPSMKKKKESINEIEKNFELKVRNLEKEITFYDSHDNCPTCKQSIDNLFKVDSIKLHGNKIKEIEDAKVKLLEKKKEVLERLEKISDIEDDINSEHMKLSDCKANIKLATNTIKSLNAELIKAEKKVEEFDTTKIQELENELKTFVSKQETLANDKEVLSIIGSMLKDGGIKTKIIRQYVPVINKYINKYLAAMDFFVQFELNDSFEETIKSRFRDEFSYGSFSEGEKLRIDLALMFTWRAISKKRNSVSTNILIMDEIMDSSLDNSGTEEFLKIIKELTSDSNVFIISHKGDQLHDKFDKVISFEKSKNFSKIANSH